MRAGISAHGRCSNAESICAPLLAKTDDERLRYSEEFEDPHQVLAAATRAGLEGIVSKLADQPYRSGKNPGWIKIKTATWREANRDRWKMFERRS